MPLSQHSKEKALAWLRSKIDVHTCQTCGGQTWSLGEMIFLLASLAPRPDSMPVVVVMCSNCANVKLFDAISMGIDPVNP